MVLKEQRVVVVTHADSDAGCRRARELLARGHRVVVTGAQATRLTRILIGQNADHVLAIAADLSDPRQRARLVERIEDRLGPITWIVDGRTGSSSKLTSLPTLHAASAA
jgi:meso-butanediol dehydrogenase/(S,S)-butanediol dehydrogenase/diacetyl reductase